MRVRCVCVGGDQSFECSMQTLTTSKKHVVMVNEGKKKKS